MPLAVIRCYSLLLDVTSCYSLSPLYHSLSLDVTRCTTRCHSPSLVVICCTTRCHLLSLDKPLVCLFINDFDYLVNICHCICAFLLLGYIEKKFKSKRKKLALSWRRPLSYRNQFLYDNGLRHERAKEQQGSKHIARSSDMTECTCHLISHKFYQFQVLSGHFGKRK